MYVDDRPDLIVFLAAFRAFLLHGFLQSPRAPPLRVCPGVGCIRGDQGPAFLCSTLICEIFIMFHAKRSGNFQRSSPVDSTFFPLFYASSVNLVWFVIIIHHQLHMLNFTFVPPVRDELPAFLLGKLDIADVRRFLCVCYSERTACKSNATCSLRPLDFPFALSCRRNLLRLHRVLVRYTRPSLTVNSLVESLPPRRTARSSVRSHLGRTRLTISRCSLPMENSRIISILRQLDSLGLTWKYGLHLCSTFARDISDEGWPLRPLYPKVCYNEIRVRASDP